MARSLRPPAPPPVTGDALCVAWTLEAAGTQDDHLPPRRDRSLGLSGNGGPHLWLVRNRHRALDVVPPVRLSRPRAPSLADSRDDSRLSPPAGAHVRVASLRSGPSGPVPGERPGAVFRRDGDRQLHPARAHLTPGGTRPCRLSVHRGTPTASRDERSVVLDAINRRSCRPAGRSRWVLREGRARDRRQ